LHELFFFIRNISLKKFYLSLKKKVNVFIHKLAVSGTVLENL
jgi:hypothetical protein